MCEMTRLQVLLALTVAWSILGGAAEGQARRDMTLVDLLEVPRLSDPQLSPDGRQVLYVVARGRLGGEPGHQPCLAG